MMAQSSTKPQNLHIAIFPFISKGHTIPILHLTKLIHNHRPQATFTIFTTPINEFFISSFLSSFSPNTISLISLPLKVEASIETTDHLPSVVSSLEELQPIFETALENLQRSYSNPISFLISDAFHHWTQESASKFNIPRFTFYGFSCYAQSILEYVLHNRLFIGDDSEKELIKVPVFPRIKLTKNDIENPWNESSEPQGAKHDFVVKCFVASSLSYGMIVNSFSEFEPEFLEYCSSKLTKSWCVGPFCLAEKPMLEKSETKPDWIKWLDEKWVDEKPVLYVAFGSQAVISSEQLKEITIGLEKSGVNFIWALRIKPDQEEIMDGFEERVKGRGLVVKGWVDQRVILEHDSVQGFLSHCGWNSVIESISAKVPILAWPMIAEQPLNARMVVEEIKIGLRIETCDGLVLGFVKWEGLCKMVKELMEGETGKMVRKKVKEVGEAAKKAVEEGGSSWLNLEALLNNFEAGLSASN